MGFSYFFAILGWDAYLKSEFLAEIAGELPRQPAPDVH